MSPQEKKLQITKIVFGAVALLLIGFILRELVLLRALFEVVTR